MNAPAPSRPLVSPALWPVLGLALLLALTLPPLSSTRILTWPFAAGAAVFWALPIAIASLRLALRRPDSRLGGCFDAAFATLTLAGLLATALSPLRDTLAPFLLPYLGALALPYALLPVLRSPRADALAAGFIYPVLAASALAWLPHPSGRNPHPFGHANTTGAFCALAACWLAVLSCRASGRVGRVAHACGAAAAAGLAASSSSRGAVLALAIAAAFAAGSVLLRRGRVITFMAVLVAAFGLAIGTNPRLREFVFQGGWSATANESNAQRDAMIRGGFALAAERPVTGWGPGAVPYVFPRVRAGLPGTPDNYLHLHNGLAQAAATLGALGLAGLALLLLALFSATRPLLRDPGQTPLLAALLCGLVILLFDHPFATPAFAALAALPIAALALTRRTEIRAGSPRWSALLPGLALALVAFPVVKDLAARAAWSETLDAADAGRPADYAAALRHAHDLAPADPFYADQLASHLATGAPFSGLEAPDPAVAAVLLLETLARNPAHESAHYNLAWLLLDTEPALARDHFAAVSSLAPTRGRAHLGLALAHLYCGDGISPVPALSAEILLDPAFAWSPLWNNPALLPHRAPTLANASDFLSSRNLAPLLATWLRNAGPPAAGATSAHRRLRTGHGVLYSHPDGPAPVDVDVTPDFDLPPGVAAAIPPRGFVSPTLVLECAGLIKGSESIRE